MLRGDVGVVGVVGRRVEGLGVGAFRGLGVADRGVAGVLGSWFFQLPF